MKLFLIEYPEYSYDEFIGFIIAAETEKDARKFATEREWEGRNKHLWSDCSKTTCKEIGIANQSIAEGIVFESMLHG